MPRVLFLCVANAGRSQMAAGWMHRLAGPGVDVFSGGSGPAEALDPGVATVMAEVGVDLSGETPKGWTDEMVRAADIVITMGCGDACPVYPGTRYFDWNVDDPFGRDVEGVRAIRDDIGQRVRRLLTELGAEPER